MLVQTTPLGVNGTSEGCDVFNNSVRHIWLVVQGSLSIAQLFTTYVRFFRLLTLRCLPSQATLELMPVRRVR